MNLDNNIMPNHIAIIMDGNGRWAIKKGLPRSFGHKAGVDALKDIVKVCSDLGVKILTVYAFSTENWKRPKDEVGYLMKLLVEYMRREIEDLNANKVKIKILGDVELLPSATKEEILNAVDSTKNNDGLQFNIALNYGGRLEILNACKNIIDDLKTNKIQIDLLDEDMFGEYLYTGKDPEPDLIIRTSGERRLSNFLLWQGAYSELVFTDTLWPDFKRGNLIDAINEYQNRNRRFGNVK